MGIDACMVLTLQTPIEPLALRRLSADLVEAIGTGPFSIYRPNQWEWHPQGQHALEIAQADDLDYLPAFVKAAPQVIIVNLSGRYYGPGYERGQWPIYDSVCQWLVERISDGTVFYGGDSDDALEEMTGAFRRAMWRHFALVGHTPYRAGWRSVWGAQQRICAFCADRPMTQYGSSGDNHYAAWICDGCGLEEITRDGGATYHDKDADKAAMKESRS